MQNFSQNSQVKLIAINTHVLVVTLMPELKKTSCAYFLLQKFSLNEKKH